ncbi:MAG: hypothetical protein SGPRY_008538, partial [Prymnesium sp.]
GGVSPDPPPKKAPALPPSEAGEGEGEEGRESAREEEAARRSARWVHLTYTGSYDTDVYVLYVDGVEAAKKETYFTSDTCPSSFLLCSPEGEVRRREEEVRLRTMTLRIDDPVTDKDAAFLENERVNHDLTREHIESVLHERAMRTQLYVPRLAGRAKQGVGGRGSRLLSSLDPPTVWDHPVCHSLFDVPSPRGQLWGLADDVADLVDMANLMAAGEGGAKLEEGKVGEVRGVEKQGKESEEWGRPSTAAAFGEAMRLLRESVRRKRPAHFRGEGGEEGEGKMSDWEVSRRRAVKELQAIRALKEGEVHVIALMSTELRFIVVLWEGAGQHSDGRPSSASHPSTSSVYHLTLISTSQHALEFHPQRASGQGLMYNTCLTLPQVEGGRALSELWWSLLFMAVDKEAALYAKVLPWLVKRPLEDLEAEGERVREGKGRGGERGGGEWGGGGGGGGGGEVGGAQGKGAGDEEAGGGECSFAHWVPMPKVAHHRPLDTLFAALRLLMLRRGCSVGQAEGWFFRLRVHLLVACAADLRFFTPGENTLDERDAFVLTHLSRVGAYEAVREGGRAISSLHALHTALHSIESHLNSHADTRRPPPPALLTLLPPRSLEQQHLHWGFDTLVPRDVTALAGDSLFDQSLSGLKAVSCLEGGVVGLHGEVGREEGELDFRGCLRLMERCLELCLQLSNLEDVKWRAHLICAALAHTFLILLPLPLPSPRAMYCAWAKMASETDAPPNAAYSLELLRRLLELLAFASGGGEVEGEDAAAWHPSLLLVSAAIAAIADAIARSGAGGERSTRLADLLCGKLGSVEGGEEEEGGRWWGVGVSAFEQRSATLLLSAEQCVARKHVLEYFHSLSVPPEREIFAVEQPGHYAGGECPTRRFFHALSHNVYCRSGAARAIVDVDHDMLHSSAGHTAFRDLDQLSLHSLKAPLATARDAYRPHLTPLSDAGAMRLHNISPHHARC